MDFTNSLYGKNYPIVVDFRHLSNMTYEDV